MIFVYILAALLILLFLIAFIRFILIKEDHIQEPAEIDQSQAKKYALGLAKMIQVKSLSYDSKLNNEAAFIELKEVMVSLFPKVFETMERMDFPGQGLLMHWPGKNQNKPIVLMSHLDVVDVEEKAWDYPPFSGTIKEGQIYGRGSLDTKSTVFAFYQACEDLINQAYIPDQDIYLYSSTNEETSGPGAGYAVEYLKEKNIHPYMVLDEGGAIVTNALPSVKQALAMVGILEKGYANIKLSAKSLGGHSSTPPKNTPLVRLSKLVSDIEDHFPFKSQMIPEVQAIFEKAGPYMKGILRFMFVNLWLFKPLIVNLLPKVSPYGRALLSTTIAFTMAKASDQANVIPSEAYIIANLRTHPIQNVNESFKVIEDLAKKYQVEVELLEHREASAMTDIHSEAYQYLEEMIKLSFKDVDVSPYVMLGGTDSRFFNDISSGVLRFSPIRMDQSELSKMHGHNESIKISTLVEAVQFYQNIIKNHH